MNSVSEVFSCPASVHRFVAVRARVELKEMMEDVMDEEYKEA